MKVINLNNINGSFDYLIVGSGLFGAVCANELSKKGFSVLVVEKRENVGGNIYTKTFENITTHVYGAHIFHTSNKDIWNYINCFASFNNFVNSPIARYKDECYNLPFNMNTFSKLWNNVITPDQAKRRIQEERNCVSFENPQNLEEQAINMVGKTIYEKLIKGYTSKQWGKPCSELPASIIKRIPVRYTYNNNYFDDLYQGIPVGGYTKIIEQMLLNSTVVLNCDFLKHREILSSFAKKIIYTGQIDAFFGFKFGPLEYRSLRFEHEVLNIEDFQGVAVVNYTDSETLFTRIIEHKHFESVVSQKTIITREYPQKWEIGLEPYYPINDRANTKLYSMYIEEAKKIPNIVFCGRLGSYKYSDMDETIENALNLVKSLEGKDN